MYELMECFDDLPDLQKTAMIRLVKTVASWQGPLRMDQLLEAQDDILDAFNTVHGMWLQQAACNIDPLKTS